MALPREAVAVGAEARLSAALFRYRHAWLVVVEREEKRNSSRSRLMLALPIVVVACFDFLAHRLDDSPGEPVAIAAEGLSSAARIPLRQPLEALAFNRWDSRLDRRVLRTIRDEASVRLDPIAASVSD